MTVFLPCGRDEVFPITGITLRAAYITQPNFLYESVSYLAQSPVVEAEGTEAGFDF